MNFAVFALIASAQAIKLSAMEAPAEDCGCAVPDYLPCEEEILDLSDITDQINLGEGAYGTFPGDTEATLVSGYLNEQCLQSRTEDIIPDVYSKVDGVESSYATTEKASKGEVEGCRTKTFTIEGCVTINEERCGGFIQKEDSCQAGTGKNSAESLSRVGDNVPELPACSAEGPFGCDCGCAV